MATSLKRIYTLVGLVSICWQMPLYAQCIPSEPPVTPQYNLAGRTITASNVHINTGGPTAVVAPGEVFSVNFNWSIGSTITACPGCITIFHFGLSNVQVPGSPGGATTYPNTHCMGSVYAGQSSYSSGTFTAPTEPGYYYITLVAKWVYWCHQYPVSHCSNAKIARIQVGNPPEIAVQVDDVLQISACDANDGAIGISVTSANDFGCYSTYWTGPNGFTASGQTSISGLAPGDYQVTLANIAGCTTTLDFTLADPCTPCIPQQIPIDVGWNMISAYMQPPDLDMASIFSGIDDAIVLLKDIDGNVYLPQLLNQVGDWRITAGYQVKALAATSLSMPCPQVDPLTTPIDLPEGWSLISYLRDTPMDAAQAWAGIIDHILLAKDESGQVFIPNLLNLIGDLQPGQGYQVKMAQPTTLTYPAND